MPQTSLFGWLNKPVSLQDRPAPIKVSTARTQNDKTVTIPRLPNPLPRDSISTGSKAETGQHGAQHIALSNEKRDLPPNVELRACAKEDIQHLKRLTSLLLPIPYPQSFYRDIIEDPVTSNITLVAIWHDDPSATGKENGKLVGGIRCRLLAHPPSSTPISQHKKEGPMLYLSTLVLLSPYRTHGIATSMLDVLTKRAVNDYDITSVGAHVWEANFEGLEWYRKRGFRVVGKEEGYYRRLKPTGAMIVQRDVGVMDLVSK